ncbi:hypothetical protein S7335_4655 [Synechococcus sp. PCC 7335]|nr:hypothetical protein S7335_4655 [Synechococcus sp. PCC 7335]
MITVVFNGAASPLDRAIAFATSALQTFPISKIFVLTKR